MCDMCKIAVCIPTYNHPKVVEDVLSKCIDDYTKCQIDMYYYDSSDNDETKEIVEKYQNTGYKNIFYVKIPSDIGGNQKMLIIFGEEGLKKEYEYIWLVKDRSFCPFITLNKILDEAKKGHDVIFLGCVNNGHMEENKIYKKPAEFYQKWGWLATSWDTVIYKRDSILSNITK